MQWPIEELEILWIVELLDPSEDDPQIIRREEYASREGMIGPFGF